MPGYVDPAARGVSVEGRLDVLLVRCAHRLLGAVEAQYGVSGLVNRCMPKVEDWTVRHVTPRLAPPPAARRTRPMRRLPR